MIEETIFKEKISKAAQLLNLKPIQYNEGHRHAQKMLHFTDSKGKGLIITLEQNIWRTSHLKGKISVLGMRPVCDTLEGIIHFIDVAEYLTAEQIASEINDNLMPKYIEKTEEIIKQIQKEKEMREKTTELRGKATLIAGQWWDKALAEFFSIEQGWDEKYLLKLKLTADEVLKVLSFVKKLSAATACWQKTA